MHASNRVAICHTKWNPIVVHALRDGCYNELLAQGVKKEDIVVIECPGS